jgi:muramoyltetrapeptide carboxypeptidase
MPHSAGRLLFFEDLNEAWYRVDRMVTQLLAAGAFDGVAAIVLGDFTDCRDESFMVMASREDRSKKQPLRKTFEPREAMAEIFGGLGRRLGIPVAAGLPVGHGPGFSPLPLGARYSLEDDGRLRLKEWDWRNDQG